MRSIPSKDCTKRYPILLRAFLYPFPFLRKAAMRVIVAVLNPVCAAIERYEEPRCNRDAASSRSLHAFSSLNVPTSRRKSATSPSVLHERSALQTLRKWELDRQLLSVKLRFMRTVYYIPPKPSVSSPSSPPHHSPLATPHVPLSPPPSSQPLPLFLFCATLDT